MQAVVGTNSPQNLDVPVTCRHGGTSWSKCSFDVPVATHRAGELHEQAVDVPKISQDRTPQRLGDCLRQPQMADQLVDVPTVVSYPSLQQLTAEHIVDIPAPGGDAGGGGVEVFKVYSQDRIQQRLTSSKPLTSQFSVVEIFKTLAQDRVQQLLHLTLVLQMQLGMGFFALFPRGKEKRCGASVRTRVRN